MRQLILVASIVAVMPIGSAAETRSGPEGFQTPPTTQMCGLVADSAQDFIDQARQSAVLLPWPSETSRFEIFQTAEPHYQLVVTTPAEPAHPAASCRETYLELGVWKLKRAMRCDAAPADCDALLIEFQGLDAAMTRYLEGGERRATTTSRQASHVQPTGA